MKTFAQFISNIFSPLTTIPLLIIVVLFNSGNNTHDNFISLLIFFLGGVVPIMLSFFYLRKTKQISDWELDKRKERYVINSIVLVVGIFDLFLAFLFGERTLFGLGMVLFLWFAIFSGITFFWKISAHAAAITLCLLFLSLFLPVEMMGLGIIIIAMVGWSRIYLNHHSFWQIICGCLLSIIVFIFTKWLLFM